MKKRYLPIIVDALGREYKNIQYKNLGDAIDALNEFKKIFASYRDDKIVDAYVLNEVTGKQIRP